MNTRSYKSFGLLSTVCVMLWLVSASAIAQTNLGLSVQTYAGLSITGAVGSACQVQYVTNLAQTNAWLPLTNLMLASNPQLWVDTTSPVMSRRFYRAVWTPPSLPLIPAGSFIIGDNLDGQSNATLTNVYVSAFYMEPNLVSYSQWQSVYGWATSQGYSFDNAGLGKGTNHPVVSVNWYDCVKWCNARSQQAGLTPVYYTDVGLTHVYTTGEVDAVYANWTANGYRLPTEAEWEKAARGGSSGLRFPWGNVISQSLANYDSRCNDSYDLGPSGYNAAYTNGGTPYTSPVGSFAPNGYGLYDMAGNANEWCWDWFGDIPYATGSPYLGGNDPHGVASGVGRVVRGGDWGDCPWNARCAGRNWAYPAIVGYNKPLFGFRCARGL